MRIRTVLPLLAVLFVPVLQAAPQITAVTPSAGPASGGTTVTITGSDFQTCVICSPPIPPVVYFGTTRALVATLENVTTIKAVTPEHVPGTVPVRVVAYNGEDTLEGGFTFIAEAEDPLERVLLPIFTPPVEGAYGSRFETTFSAFSTSIEPLPVPGLTRFGITLCPTDEVELAPYQELTETAVIEQNGSPGRFIYLPRNEADYVSMNLRVQDVSRDELNFGTEIPVVRWSDVPLGPLTLTGVPLDLRFRQALRIYSTLPVDVLVSVGGVQRRVSLRPGRDEFDPAYGVFTEFPQPSSVPLATVLTRVNVQPLDLAVRIWAFVTVTNNETQAITTISPQF
jgi:hypothetical protein